MADRLEEAIRVVIETQGREGVDELRLAFGNLGDISVEAAAKTADLLDSLTGLNAAAGKLDSYQRMTEELAQLESSFDANQRAAYQLSLQIMASESPSKEMLNAQRQLKIEAEKLSQTLSGQRAAMEEVAASLAESGLAASDAGKSQAALSARLAGVNAELLEHANALKADAQRTAQYRDDLDGLSGGLADMSREFQQFSSAVAAVGDELSAIDKPNARLLAQQRALTEESENLERLFKDQASAIADASNDVDGLAENSARLAKVQEQIAEAYHRTIDAIEGQSRAVRQEADDARRRNMVIEDADERFRRQAQSSKVAAKALADYRERAADAAAGSGDLASATESTVSWFGRLKAVAAGAIAFVGLNRVVDGIKAIVKEGSDAEQELAQLEAALHATGRTSEFTAQSLAAMRQQLQSGLFDDGQISAAQVRLLSYTNIVGEQFPAAMQITIDQAQRLGMSLEQSAEVVGKALQTPSKAMESLSKQGFTLDDSQKALIKSLEATGQVAQAQSIILDLLAESYGGAAAAAKVGTIAGLWKAATDRFKDWKQEVADQGVLAYFKDQLTTLLATLDRLAKDGSLTRWAKQTSQAIIGMAEAVKGATRWVADHARVIGLMAAAYAQFKVVGALLQLNAWRAALLATTRAQLANNAAVAAGSSGIGGFGLLLRGLPKAVPIAVSVLGLEAAMGGLSVLKTVAQDIWKQHDPALKRAGEAQRAYISQVRDSALELRRQAVSFIEYRDVVVKTTEEVARMGQAEREAYAQRLAGLEQYLTAQEGFLLMQQKAGVATAAQLQELGLVTQQLLAVSTGYAGLSKAVNIAADAMKSGIGGAAQLVVEQLQGVQSNARLATDSISKMMSGLNFADTGSLAAVGTALGYVASQGAAAERNVRDGLLESLRKLSGEELARFQAASQAAFEALPQGAANAAAVLQTTLLAAMEKLGVSASRLGVQFTGAGRDAIAAFGAVSESAVATGVQIEEAFKAALGKVATLDEARTLGALLEAAGTQGKVGFDAAARSAAALNARIRDIQASVNPLADEFARLGIQSQESLNNTRDSAKAAFEAIQRGASQGKASIEDVRRAFEAYASTARAAVADSDDWRRGQVESQLQVQGQILQTGQHLKDMGGSGQSAMQQVQAGAQAGTQAVGQLAQETSQAGNQMENLGNRAEQSGQQMGKAGQAAQSMAFSIGEVSDAALKAMRNLSGPNPLQQFANALNRVTAQRKQLAEYKKELQGLAETEDEFASSAKSRLAYQYDYLGKQEVAEVAALEAQVQRKRAEQDRAAADAVQERRRAAQAEANAQAQLDAGRIQAGADKEQVLIIDWKVPSKEVVAGATAQELQQAQRIANLVTPMVLTAVQKSRSVSVRGRGR
ncbi:Laminin subunit alpha-2 [Stenotrophomonas maltophilia]|uniref:Laminin subunit alpha-2 n=1 Tax=Stenotrophomonas maltophilia TaxID=40324 RepID=UPI001FA7F8C5|nr:Laminin subunit alpha-2 [Stenotrophomonas maltophilia]